MFIKSKFIKKIFLKFDYFFKIDIHHFHYARLPLLIKLYHLKYFFLRIINNLPKIHFQPSTDFHRYTPYFDSIYINKVYGAVI